jgi:hypothetical protein
MLEHPPGSNHRNPIWKGTTMATRTLTTSEANPSFSAGPGLSTSHADAALAIAKRTEPTPSNDVEAAGAASINRRSIMNMIVSAAALTATSLISDQAAAQADDSVLL